MTTPPKVHRAEVSRAIARIAARRTKVDDPNREKLPDAPDADPAEVLDYLQQYSGHGIERWVKQADVSDALTLTNWLWWQHQRRLRYWLKQGRDQGLFLSQIGAQLGIKKQGVIDKADRLEALLRYDRPDEQLSRTARRLTRQAHDRDVAETSWIDMNREQLLATISALVGHADRYHLDDEEREWVDELASDARDQHLTSATMVILGFAAAELRAAPAVLALNSTQAVHRDVAAAESLRSKFADLGYRDYRDLRTVS